MERLAIVRIQFCGPRKLIECLHAITMVEKDHASEGCMGSWDTVIEFDRFPGRGFRRRQRLEGINFTPDCLHCVTIGKPGPAKRIVGLNLDGLLVVPAGIFISSDDPRVALRLNQRPRKTLGFETPASKLQASVASTS
jgi:hypothetical protein